MHLADFLQQQIALMPWLILEQFLGYLHQGQFLVGTVQLF